MSNFENIVVLFGSVFTNSERAAGPISQAQPTIGLKERLAACLCTVEVEVGNK